MRRTLKSSDGHKTYNPMTPIEHCQPSWVEMVYSRADNVTSNVMVGANDGTIIYMNGAVTDMFTEVQDEIRVAGQTCRCGVEVPVTRDRHLVV